MTAHAPYDLHLHTCWSYDATVPVERYFRQAQALGMRCIAITDHHVVDSLDDVVAAARRYPDIVAIPSAELTVHTSIGDVDLLCYGLPLEPPPELQRILKQYHAWQRDTGAAISRGLQALGHAFSDAQRLALLQSYRPARVIAVQGNTHVKNGLLRAHLIERGIIAGADAYRPFMSQLRRVATFPPYPRVEEVVPAVKAVGAMVAIAHPHAYFAKGDPERMDRLRTECDLDGIECAHHAVPATFTAHYRAYCEQHGLFSTGGSDIHAEEEIPESFARHGGAAEWLDEFLERVGERAIRRDSMRHPS